MDQRKQQLDDFYTHYSDLFNKGIREEISDVDETAALYTDSFIAANPQGVNCGKNDRQLRELIKKGYDFYKKIGITSMEIVSKEITLLDDFHAMTRVRWKCSFTRKDGTKGSIEFENIYFTQNKEDKHKVFSYITGDEQATLKKLGLI